MDCKGRILKAIFPDPKEEVEGIIIKEETCGNTKYRFIQIKNEESKKDLLENLNQINEDETNNTKAEFFEFKGSAGELIEKMKKLNSTE